MAAPCVAAVSSRAQRSPRLEGENSKEREGNGEGAYGECSGGLSELGEASGAAYGRRRSQRTEVEEDGASGVAVRPRRRGSPVRKRKTSAVLGDTSKRRERVDGRGGRRRWRRAPLGRGWGESQRRERGTGRVGKVRGGRGRVCGTRRRRPGCRQKQEVAGVWLRASGTRLSSSWREEGDDWQ